VPGAATGYEYIIQIHNTLRKEVIMFNYKAYKRFEKARKQNRWNNSPPIKHLFMFRENKILNCWRFESVYEKVDGIKLYDEWARGEGEVARHLCSNSKCVNPIHLLRGSWIDNAKDEIEVRDFENELMMEMLQDWSMKGEDPGLIHLSMLPRIGALLSEVRGMRPLSETNAYLREYYRQHYVRELIKNQHLIKPETIRYAEEKMLYLLKRDDINIIIVKGE
jgi:hypothetical protein